MDCEVEQLNDEGNNNQVNGFNSSEGSGDEINIEFENEQVVLKLASGDMSNLELEIEYDSESNEAELNISPRHQFQEQEWD